MEKQNKRSNMPRKVLRKSKAFFLNTCRRISDKMNAVDDLKKRKRIVIYIFSIGMLMLLMNILILPQCSRLKRNKENEKQIKKQQLEAQYDSVKSIMKMSNEDFLQDTLKIDSSGSVDNDDALDFKNALSK